MDKLDMQSPNLVNQNFEKLAELFPNCVTEGADGKAIDFDLLKQEVNHAVVEGNKERYRLEWPGKREAIVTANLPITKTLRPVREDSVDFDNTENIYIEGDNLEVLKLLQQSYLGRVKMIYIDPPYNTGNDFVYKDNFSKDANTELLESGQKDESNNRLKANPETSGRYHSDWLSMIYPRLKLARNLLKDDGAIFISINDSEIANLRKLCDEVFGDDKFIACFVWKTRQASGKQIALSNSSQEHDYILCYGRTLNGIARDSTTYTNPDNDPRGIWAKHPLDVGSTKEERPNCFYDLVDPATNIRYPANPNRVWAFAPTSMAKLLEEGKIIFHPEGKTRPGLKKFFNELKTDSKPISTWLDRETFGIGFNTEGTKIVNELFDGEKFFDYPKPVSLIQLLIEQASDSDDLVLDFFSGSGTTAQAVWKSAEETGVSRKFILVQLPEQLSEDSSASKAGFKNICDIGKERIRRAGKKTIEAMGSKIDCGFRVFRLDESNMQDVYYSPQDYDQSKMDMFTDNVKLDRTADDLLAQVMLDWGLPLSLKIESIKISGKTVFKVADNSLYASFDQGLDEAFAKEIAKDKPLRVVFRDSGFKDNSAKTNVKQLLKQLSPETEMKVV
ncbi:site-specific DNA-methyltransferase [Candidatus Methylopumilus turicensis]|uniref:site-specific DNA-methyltransferase (adenine-specific) n=1 Tax=Candidatus Methylopumilus turicensis TaxID=1581680 RepID=A0A0B7IVV6_9PROT|nr:site-specific DNA-methyltransferase [Candidatus Methylopumilus turicensis]CEN56467.1 Type III restriction-modification system methylation subunit [Candidatus Methylopumilus turicensis]